MNILIFNWRDPRNPKAGGAEIVTLEHAKAWVVAGHEVIWIANMFRGAKKEEMIDGVHIIRRGGIFSQFILFPMYYFLNRRNIDIVIDEIHGLPYLSPLYVGKKRLAFIHEVAVNIWNSMFPFPFNAVGMILERISLSFYKTTPFLTVSESTEHDLKSLGMNNITVIHNGIRPISVKAEKEKNPTFIFISRLVKMKGVEDVIKAFKIILEEQKLSKLWIVGEGEKEYLDQLILKVREYGLNESVVFWGKITEEAKYKLLKKAHILLHASVREGWGLVVIEAASQGTPSVVYDVEGLRDSVRDGETGIVVQKNTPEILAANALELINDKKLYKEYQDNSIIWAKSLAWEKATENSLKLINSL